MPSKPPRATIPLKNPKIADASTGVMPGVRSPIIGPHPGPDHPFGEVLAASDGHTESMVPHRALTQIVGAEEKMVAHFREMVIRHHTRPDELQRSKAKAQALMRLGFGKEEARLRRFPINDKVQKGNFVEIVLAEYIAATSRVNIPVYRLRYNPNVDESMKGDDVLAFDLDSTPVRIVVGEAKFRNQAVAAQGTKDIVASLLESHKSGIPTSLQFVADRLYEERKEDLARRIESCAILFATGKLRIDYVGMLLSGSKCAEQVRKHTTSDVRRLAMISLGISDGDALVQGCFSGLD